MGRRPLADKRRRKAPTSQPEVMEHSGGVEKQPEAESSAPPSGQEKLQLKETNPQLEPIEPKPNAKTKSADVASVSTRMKHIAVMKPRRSERLQSAVTPSQDKDIERIIEEITLSGSEKDEEPNDFVKGPFDFEEKLPEQTTMHKSLGEKVDYLLQQLEEQKQTIEELKLKVARDSSPTGSPGAADVKYKSLYCDSQKKIETLADENHQLALKLEHACGKVEAYEKMASVFAEGLDKLKDVVLVTSLTRATETAMKLSSQTLTSMGAGAKAKRKKLSSQTLTSVGAGAEAKRKKLSSQTLTSMGAAAEAKRKRGCTSK